MTHTLAELDQIVGGMTEQMNDKLDLPEGLSQANIDYVIEFKAPTAADLNWYRLYKSGWIEQGGYVNHTNSTYVTINFLKQFSDTSYCVTLGGLSSSSSYPSTAFTGYYDKTASSMKIGSRTYGGEDLAGISWEAKGFIA